MNCRHCNSILDNRFLDLGSAPPSNAYLTEKDLARPEVYYPLRIQVCVECWLVQTEDYAEAAELFSPTYAYFSSTSSGWLAHASRYVEIITERLELNRDSFVIEVACNDGYLLKNFVDMDIGCLGIEPTDSTAQAAENLGIPVIREFFGEALGKQLAEEEKQADLLIGNNVYAHVPDINDFTRGLKAALKPGGSITLEFPHLMQLIKHNQFDTVYHEHFSYLSLCIVVRIFENAGLRVYHVEELPTHGGSLRVFGCHGDDAGETTEAVRDMLQQEATSGLQELATYQAFQSRADQVKDNLLDFLLSQKRAGKTVMAYGAAAKGNTLLNYAGVKPDLLPRVFDAAAAKQDKFLPGSHVPILSSTELPEQNLDYLLILPWNIADEVKQQNAALAKAGTKFVTAVPQLRVS